MVRIVAVEKPDDDPTYDIVQDVRQFLRLKELITRLTAEANQYRDKLSQVVAQHGEEDENGSRWLELPTEVEGVLSLKRERRVSQTLDPDVAEEILKNKGLVDRCYRMVPTLDEDAVMACLYEDLLTPEDLDAMYPKKITWAFVPSKKR